jgi:hypothetical protein
VISNLNYQQMLSPEFRQSIPIEMATQPVHLTGQNRYRPGKAEN